jgi:DNA modification methylase
MTDTAPAPDINLIPQRYEALVPFDQLTPHPRNPNEGDLDLLDELLRVNGFGGAILAQEGTGVIIDGEQRRERALAGGLAAGPVIWLDVDDEQRDRLLAEWNESGRRGVNDMRKLVALLQGLEVTPQGLAGSAFGGDQLAAMVAALGDDGLGDQGGDEGPGARAGSLADRFLVPPFSVLDARQGYWQLRKRAWLALGIRSELGRPRNLLKMSDTVLDAQRPNHSQPERQHAGTIDEWRARDGDHRQATRRGPAAESGAAQPNRSAPGSDSGNDPQFYYKKRVAEAEAGRELSTEEFTRDWYEGPDSYIGGTSIFDPVLAELAYRWWCPPAGRVLDPFAGGSVRGVVASRLDLEYTGVDLSEAQVEANREQATEIGPGGLAIAPAWHQGDARDITEAWPPASGPFDLVFTCPPYFDLEQYSGDPADLSNATSYDEFMTALAEVLTASAARLAPDRFAVLVVGEIRDPKGMYRGLVPDVIAAAAKAGLAFYNEAILVTSVGSLALRAARIFSGGRKLGKAHQNVLVFVKGDPGRAAQACGELIMPDPAELFGTLGSDGDPAASASEPEGVQLEPQVRAPDGEPAANMRAPDDASPAPAWAKGLPLGRLREVAQLWRAHDGDLPMGAFMGVKENQVAEWAAAQRLTCWGRDGQLAAAAVVSLATGQAVTDFRGQPIARPPRGATIVHRFAGDPRILAAELVAPLDGRAFRAGRLQGVWLWAWMENPADRWLTETLGLSWQGTKIRASSELIGLFGPPAATDPLPGIDAWGLVRLDREFDPAPLLAEVAAAEPGWADHYAVYNKRGSWQAVSLRGYGPDPSFIIKPAEMSRKWKQAHEAEMGWTLTDTPLYKTLPGIRALVNSLPGRKHRVRLMRLAPGNGELTRHSDITDPDAGTQPGQLLRIHLPLVTNPLVVFRTWTPQGAVQTAHMAAGEAWYLDTRKPHTARNDGPAERIHVVADIEATPKLLALATRPAPAEYPTPAYQPPPPGEWEPWPLT